MGIICAVEPVTGYGSEWYMQEFDNDDGTLDAINLYDENGEVAYTGKSRVECFRWAYENNVEITGYQHGGK